MESTTATMAQEQLQSECAKAFKQGNKQDAERLLPQIEQPADIRAYTCNIPDMWWYVRLVSLLHLAAAMAGWILSLT